MCDGLTRPVATEQYAKGQTKVQRKANDGKTSMNRVPLKTRVAGVKLTSEQYRVIEQRAERCKVSVSVWMRSVLMQAASRPAKNGYLRIHEPDGAMT
jgi:hypothetical protein